jgi:hypothetical protein
MLLYAYICTCVWICHFSICATYKNIFKRCCNTWYHILQNCQLQAFSHHITCEENMISWWCHFCNIRLWSFCALLRCQYLYYIKSNGRIIDGCWTWQDLETRGLGVIAVWSRSLPELLEENHAKSQPNISGVKTDIWTEYLPNMNL